jgi:phosphatidylglycerol:prolipoprotein diacylglycerol transferase
VEFADLDADCRDYRRPHLPCAVLAAGASRGFNYYFFEQPFATISVFGAAIPFPTALRFGKRHWHFWRLVAGILALYVYTRETTSTLALDDIMAPGVLLAQAIGRWGNYVNQELYGPPTTLPWVF